MAGPNNISLFTNNICLKSAEEEKKEEKVKDIEEEEEARGVSCPKAAYVAATRNVVSNIAIARI